MVAVLTQTRTALGLALAVGLSTPAFDGRGMAQSGQDDVARALRGAIDVHVHTSPDSRARALDALEAARFARDRGMRAIVLKNHYEWTSGLAFIVRRAVPGIDVFGGVDLNLPVGGLNPAAIDYMAQTTGGFGRIVWMPTFDAENQVRVSKESRPFVAVSRDGELLPATRDVLARIAKHNLALATGHSSAAEVLMLLREAGRVGVRRMIVTHAMNAPIEMTVPQMQEAAKLGAFVEFVGGSLAGPDAAARLDRFAAAIRQIGPASSILSSDLGQQGNALPAEGFAAFLLGMRARGFSDADIDRMAKRNPAVLLGLE
jgi:hypothetical protein